METFIKFAYTGQIFWDDVTNFQDLILNADFFGLVDIKEEAIKIFAADHLGPLNALDAYHYSDIWSNSILKEKSQKTILQNFEAISKTEKFLKLNINSFKDILSSNPFTSCTQDMFDGILRWVDDDSAVRIMYLMDLFGLIQFGHADLHIMVKIATEYK